MKHLFLLSACALMFLVLGCQFKEEVQPASLENAIVGTILDEKHLPIANAVVRVKATEQFSVTDSEGRFVLADIPSGQSVILTAWAEDYYIGGGDQSISSGTHDVQIILDRHADEDNPDYQWVSAFAGAGVAGNCENCHSHTMEPDGASDLPLPFDEWALDAHALSVKNPRFLTMYLGQDVAGNQSPPTRYGSSIDYGSFPLRYDLNQPYHGPGYKLDFPNTSGNCAACHAPAASINDSYATDPTQLTGVGREGVTCDFCHKVWDMRLDPTSGLPFPNTPGVLSFEFRRPPEGHQFFAGPFDDVAPGEDTFTPIQRKSQFCAPCHFGVFWNVGIYNSFGEWLESPYSDVERAKSVGLSTSKTCQDCHMPAGRNDHFARIEKGAVNRDPQTIFGHKMPGASDVGLLQNAVTMTTDVGMKNGRVVVNVTITNDGTGHHVPTDSPLRQMILLVEAFDSQDQPLEFKDGPLIPEYGGVGDPAQGYYAGLPGKIFAKVLMELWTEYTPSGAYWNPTRVLSDNRIPAMSADNTTYKFTVPSDGKYRVKVTLLFRRAFRVLMDQKGWDVADIVMEEEILAVP